MQWLIDIVKEIIHGQLGYFYRGDPIPFDFGAGDFTQDGTWRDFDLSAIVPPDTRFVAMRVQVRSAAINKKFMLRAKGQVNESNIVEARSLIANVRTPYFLGVNVDSDRKASYKVDAAGFNLIIVTICGWWLR